MYHKNNPKTKQTNNDQQQPATAYKQKQSIKAIKIFLVCRESSCPARAENAVLVVKATNSTLERQGRNSFIRWYWNTSPGSNCWGGDQTSLPSIDRPQPASCSRACLWNTQILDLFIDHANDRGHCDRPSPHLILKQVKSDVLAPRGNILRLGLCSHVC